MTLSPQQQNREAIDHPEKHPDLVYEHFRILLTIRVTENWHSGYCSDAGETQIEKTTEIKDHPLLRIFTQEDFQTCEGWKIPTGHPVLQYYCPNNFRRSCDCGTYYKIKSAEIVDMRKPVLE